MSMTSLLHRGCAAALVVSTSFPAWPEEPAPAPAAPALAPPGAAAAPAGPVNPNALDQKKIDAAIDSGCKWLLVQTAKGPCNLTSWEGEPIDRDAFVLYTLLKGGADRTQPGFRELVDRCLKAKVDRVYFAATLAMALETLDGEAYQSVIRACAQYLVDSQCANGQWPYEGKVPMKLPVLTGAARRAAAVATGGGGDAGAGGGTAATSPPPAHGGGTGVLKRDFVYPRYKGPDTGDNSNTQYAILGLMACSRAGIDAPKATWEKAKKWWTDDQQADGGWRYKATTDEHSYLSMSEGGLGSMIICCQHLKEPWGDNAAVKKAIDFLAGKIKITENIIGRHGEKNSFLYYHLYALERAGAFSNKEQFGTTEWYPEGARWLLQQQAGNGSWEGKVSDVPYCDRLTDTCFAILFLRRASRVYFTGSAGKGK